MTEPRPIRETLVPAMRDRRTTAAGAPGRGRAAAVLTLVLAGAAGCASDGPTRPETGQGPSYDRSELVPSGVTEMRDQMASQRTETLDRMDAMRPESVELDTHDGSDPLGSVLDAFGWAAGKTLDVLSLQAFGLW